MSSINFRIGKIRYGFASREAAMLKLDEIQAQIANHQAAAKRLAKLHSDMKKAIEAVAP